MASQTFGWLLILALQFSMYANQARAQDNSCNATAQQPVVNRIFPPSGTTGTSASLSSNYSIEGERLTMISQIIVQYNGGLNITLQNLQSTDSSIMFNLQSTFGLQRTPGGTPATLQLVPTNAACERITDTIAIHETISFNFDVELTAQSGSTVFAGPSSCYPPICGDNSTEFNMVVAGITLENLQTTSGFAARFPNFDLPDDTRSSILIRTQYQTFVLTVSLRFNLFNPGIIESVTPSQGQRGTRVTIRGQNLLSIASAEFVRVSLSRVSLGDNAAEIISSNQTVIQIRAVSGNPGSTTIRINTTQTFGSQQQQQNFDGPYTSLENGWVQLENGVVNSIIPPAAQPGRTVTICGDRLQGGGNVINTITFANISVTNFLTTTFMASGNLPGTECVSADVPNLPAQPQIRSGSIMITADTGAIVESTQTFTFAEVQSVSPARGQVGTLVTITGIALLSGYDTVMPVVYLSDVQATVMRYNSTRIVVRAEEPLTPSDAAMSGSALGTGSGSGQGGMATTTMTTTTAMPEPEIFGVTGNVAIVVTSPLSFEFNVSDENRWTYERPGEILTVSPGFGQAGTRITITGTNLIGYGSILLNATIGNVTAMIMQQSDTEVVLNVSPSTFIGLVDIVLFSDTGAQIRGESVFEYREMGSITGVQPNSGQNGTYVTISGTNLFGYGNNITGIKFGNISATIDYTQTTTTSIRVRIAANINTMDTPVPIEITADTFAVVSSTGNIWTYLVQGAIQNVQPAQGQEGTRITIDGTNLLGGGGAVENIFLDGVNATVMTATSSRITVVMGSIGLQRTNFFPSQVYIMANTGAIVFGGSYTHRASGQITSFSPQQGREGTFIRITGNDLLGFGMNVSSVQVAGANATVLSSNNTVISIRAGMSTQISRGPIRIMVDTNAVITSATNFTYIQPGMVTDVVPTRGAEGTGVLVRGTSLIPDMTQVTNITVGGILVSRIVTATSQEVSFIVGPAPETNRNRSEIVITANDGSVINNAFFSFIDLVISLTGRTMGQEGTTIDVALPPSTTNTTNFEPSLNLIASVDDQEAEVVSFDTLQRTITVRIPRARRQGTFTADVAVESTDRLVARLRNAFTYLPEGVIYSVTPTTGQMGTVVSITGENLLGGGTQIMSVMIAGVATGVISGTDEMVQVSISENLTGETVTFPQLGDVVLIADTGALVRRLNGFTLLEPGQITTINPTSGQFGTRVTITGTGLLQGSSTINITNVILAGVVAAIRGNATDTQFTVEAGAVSSRSSGPVVITLLSGAVIMSDTNTAFQYLDPGTISSVEPNGGPEGTRVTISGTNLLGGGRNLSQVLLGGVPANITGFNSTAINVTANPGTQPGFGDIEITADTGAMIRGPMMWFYERLGNITTISPTVGQQGVNVTISGQSLLGISGTSFTECLLAGIPAMVQVPSNTQVVCTAGENPNSRNMTIGIVQLTTNTGVVIRSVLNTTNFTYYSSFVDQIQPTCGNNGTNVVITGINLFGLPDTSFAVRRVTFGNVDADVVTSSASETQVRVSLSLNETLNDTVRIESTSGSIVELQNAWSYTEPGKILDISPSFGFPGENITISGVNLVPESATNVTVILGQSESFSATIINSNVIEIRAGVYDGLDNPDEGVPIQIISSTGETIYDNSILFTYNETVGEVISFTPEAGEAGTVVIISGVDLLNNQTLRSVSIGGIEVSEIINATENEIVVRVGTAPSEGTAGPIVIETNDGQFVGVGGDTWRYYPVLSASVASPQTGQNGTMVAIDLSTFEDLPSLGNVYLTGVPAIIIELNSDQILTVRAGPSNATQLGNIRLEFVNGTSLTISNAWSYQSPVTITNFLPGFSGYFNTSLTLTGTNFLAGGVTLMDVFLAGIETTAETYNNTEIQLRITEFRNSSSAPIVGPIVIITSEGATYTSSVNFTYVQVRIDVVSPQMGTDGTRVNISGVGILAGGSSVETILLGEIEARVTSTSDSFILAVAAPFPNATNISDIVYIMDTGAVVTIQNSWQYTTPGEITGVTPTEGNMGTIVTITGTNLFGGGNRAEMVLLNNVPASDIVVNFDNLIQVVSGQSNTALSPGLIQIVADTGAVTGSTSAVMFGYLTPGVLMSVDPQEGQNGTQVTIRGMFLHNGEGIRRVLLAGVEALIETVSENNLASGFPANITVRAGRPSSFGSFIGNVQIESNFNTTSISSDNFTYLSEGTIFSVTPEQGQNGTLVTIRGENLFGGGTNLTTVLLAGVEATIVSANSTLVIVTVGENDNASPITGDVVFIADSAAYVRRTDGWTYVSQGEITSITPPAGQFGTNITISGQMLLSGGSSIAEVLLDNITVYSIISSTDTEIQVRVGEPDITTEDFTTSSVTLRSNFGGVLYQMFPWNYTNQSLILDISPQNGSGLTTVTLTGENLLGGGSSITRVETAGISANRIISSNDSVVVFVTGFNPDGQQRIGEIQLESDTGALTISRDVWTYDTECPPGEYGTIGACFPCDDECELCFGGNNTECFMCRNFAIDDVSGSGMQCVGMCPNVSTLDNVCRDVCELNQFVRVNSSQNVTYCNDCHPLCDPNLGCSGPEPSQCGACRFVFNTLNQSCVEECPIGTHSNESDSCIPCNSQCVLESGCYGSSPAECYECTNVRVSATLIDETSQGSNDVCLERCPSLFYLDPDTDYCFPCSQECAANCSGPTAFDCGTCRNYSLESTNGLSRCVLNCNPDPSMVMYYEDINGVCQLCSNRCSLTGGCQGPTAKDCNGCRFHPDTSVPLPTFDGECINTCPNETYYQDNRTNQCERCSSTCTNGCTGPTFNDCLTGTQNTFAAGGGTIAVVVIFIIILLIILVVLGVFMVIQHRNHKGYAYEVKDDNNIEMGTRYNEITANTDFSSQPPPSSSTAEKQPEKALQGVANVAFEDGELYTEMELGAEKVQEENEVTTIDDVYTDMEPGSPQQQQQQQKKDAVAKVETSIPETQTEQPPSRPPKPTPKTTETKKQPAPPPTTNKESKAPPCPPTPEMYTDMRAGVQEVFINPATQGPDEEYSEMSPVHTTSKPEQEFYEDAESVRGTLPQSSHPPSEPKAKPRSEERAPLIKTESQIEDNLYEETETAVLAAVQYRRVHSNAELPPALPTKPVPKKRYSTPLPQTPLQRSVSSTSSLPIASPETDPVYIDTEGPIEESLYEDIPGRLLPDLPSPTATSPKKGEQTQSSKGKKDKKKRK